MRIDHGVSMLFCDKKVKDAHISIASGPQMTVFDQFIHICLLLVTVLDHPEDKSVSWASKEPSMRVIDGEPTRHVLQPKSLRNIQIRSCSSISNLEMIMCLYATVE